MTNTLKIKTIIIITTVDILYYYISWIYKIKSQRPLIFNIIKGVPSLNCAAPHFNRTTVLLLWWLTMLCKHYWMTYFWRNNNRKTNLHNTEITECWNIHIPQVKMSMSCHQDSAGKFYSGLDKKKTKKKKSMVVPPPSGHREDVLGFFPLLNLKIQREMWLDEIFHVHFVSELCKTKKRQFKTLNSY